MSWLSSETTQHEIEGDHKEEKETKFGDYKGDSVYGFLNHGIFSSHFSL